MVDTHAYFGQPGVFPQFQPQTLAPQSPFGVTPTGQYAQLLGQLIAGWLAQQQLAGQLGAGLGPTAVAPYSAFSGLPSQYASPFGQPTGGWPGYSQFGAFPPQTLFGSPQGQFGAFPPQTLFGSPQGQFGAFAGLPGSPSPHFPLPFGAGGMSVGRPHAAAGPQGFPALGGQSMGEISAWQPQIASQLLGAALGRSFQPYQLTSPMACVA